MTDTATDYVCASALSERRNLFIIRDLVAVVEPRAVITDGCKSIEAALHWFPKIPHGRCWFYVLLEACRRVQKEDRPNLVADLQVSYENETLPAAERWLRHLMDRYDRAVLMPLTHAWHGLQWWWKLPAMPLTHNTSEHLYGNLWPRQKKRDERTDTRRKAWLEEALWRHNHKPVGTDKSPFEAFFNLPAKASSLSWLDSILPKPHTTFT